MKQIQQQNGEKKINEMISIVKLVSLFFCVIVIYEKVFQNNLFGDTYKDFFKVNSTGLLLFSGIFLWWLFSHMASNVYKVRYIKLIRMIENTILIIIYTALILITNTYSNQIKCLFLLVIISATLQLGKKMGLLTAFISSVIILIIDFTYVSNGDINYYFQNDLIIVGVFILTAWPLGYYKEIEDKRIENKDVQLKFLSSELEKKDKQRSLIEEGLIKNKSCYNLLIENCYEAILVHRNNKLIFVNESAAKLLDFNSPSELIGKSIMSLLPMEERSNLKDGFCKIYREQLPKFVFEEKLLNNNNNIINIENTSSFFIYEGKPTILSILRNITSEKEVEELQKDVEKNTKLLKESREFNTMITEFFINISHELKTPLNLIFSALQMIKLYNNKEKQCGNVIKRNYYVDIMRINSYRLLKLINNLLDLTKSDSGFLKLQLENSNIVAMIEDITLSISDYVESKGINLIFDTNVEEKVMAVDGDKIERIMLNLLSNAVKFTNSGGEILVNVVDEDDKVYISVKDTGIGIPDDKKKLIFERFGQVDKTLSRNREGTGLGLSLVKSFVELHGGTIHIESQVGVGSNFIVELPVKHVEKNAENKAFYETDTERINIEFSDIYS
ncbi:PAS domain-containing sensor histidine kinase [Clostridium arbusti]|uniref:PAS domain-containing sensor histidine kinase n=1 Tax=Clostridium arbusti TaxID=1137848 RepID=UPI00028995C8|nr:PAS domain-containing sensor histidine kinase [Clostridium arbusti]